jgi:hypothetical protein
MKPCANKSHHFWPNHNKHPWKAMHGRLRVHIGGFCACKEVAFELGALSESDNSNISPHPEPYAEPQRLEVWSLNRTEISIRKTNYSALCLLVQPRAAKEAP